MALDEEQTAPQAGRATGAIGPPLDQPGIPARSDDRSANSVQWEIDRLGQESRESTARLSAFEDGLRLLRKQSDRIPGIDEAIRQLRDVTVALRQAVDSITEQQERQIAFRAAGLEHERRLQSETQQAVADLQRVVESVQTRTHVMTEDVRRFQSALTTIGQSADEVAKRVVSVANRLQQGEDFARRQDMRTAALEQRETQVREDIMRLDNWQRLSDIRWNRQFAESSQAIQAIAEQGSEQMKTVQSSQRLLLRGREDVERLQATAAEHQRLLDLQAAEQQRVEALALSAIDAAARVAQYQEALQRRIDEHSDSIIRAEESAQRGAGRFTELERQIDTQRLRSDGLAVQVRGAESRLEQLDQGNATLQRQLGDASLEFAEQITQSEDRQGARLSRLTDALTELLRVQAASAQRRAALQEQDVEALRAISATTDPVAKPQ